MNCGVLSGLNRRDAVYCVLVIWARERNDALILSTLDGFAQDKPGGHALLHQLQTVIQKDLDAKQDVACEEVGSDVDAAALRSLLAHVHGALQ